MTDRKAKDAHQSSFGARVTSIFDWVSRRLRDLSEAMSSSRIVEVYTFREAVEYLVTHKSRAPGAVKGAMLMQAHVQGKVLVLAFLDDANEMVCDRKGVPIGAKIIAKRFDEELDDEFREKDCVIVD